MDSDQLVAVVNTICIALLIILFIRELLRMIKKITVLMESRGIMV